MTVQVIHGGLIPGVSLTGGGEYAVAAPQQAVEPGSDDGDLSAGQGGGSVKFRGGLSLHEPGLVDRLHIAFAPGAFYICEPAVVCPGFRHQPATFISGNGKGAQEHRQSQKQGGKA